MLASFMLFVDFYAVSWEGVKFRGRACQRCDRPLTVTGNRINETKHADIVILI